MTHVFHQWLGDRPRPILYDDCPECDKRATESWNLDDGNFEEAWRLMVNVEHPSTPVDGPSRYRTRNEGRLCSELYRIAVMMERYLGLNPWRWPVAATVAEDRLEALKQASTYGICRVCGAPRQSELRTEGTTKLLILTCPNGHVVAHTYPVCVCGHRYDHHTDPGDPRGVGCWHCTCAVFRGGSEVDAVRESYADDPTITPAEYGRMIEEADDADRARELEAEREER